MLKYMKKFENTFEANPKEKLKTREIIMGYCKSIYKKSSEQYRPEAPTMQATKQEKPSTHKK